MPGSIKKQGKDSWRIRYELPRDPATGKRRQGSETVRGTKKDAERRLREILSEIDSGAHLEPSRMTTGEYMQQWFEAHSASLRPKSQERYEGLLRAHILPELGHIPLTKLAPVHIQKFYTQKVKGGRQDGKEGGLSPASVRYLHNILREALEETVNLSLIAANPAARVKPPRVQQPEIRPLSEKEVKAFLEAAKGTRFEALFVTALAPACGGVNCWACAGKTWI